MELLDLYDDNGQPLGKTIERGNKFENGNIMLSIVFIKNDEEKFLIQKTSQEKGCYYSTTGGHVGHEENGLITILREIKEELGVSVNEHEIKLVDIVKHPKKPCLINLYLLEKNFVLGALKLQENEVDSVEWKTKEEILELIEEKNFLESHGYLFKNYILKNAQPTEELFYNPDNLEKSDIDESIIRVKALIINEYNEILFGYCNKTYQFPGGHLEENETIKECLIREIKEETGIVLDKVDSNPFVLIRYWSKNYRNTGKNRENLIYYFIIKNSGCININDVSYTLAEQKGNYEIRFIPIDKIERVLNSTVVDNPINKIIVEEILEVIKIYKTINEIG